MSTTNSIKNARCGICASVNALQQYRITIGEGTELDSTDYRMMCGDCVTVSLTLQQTESVAFKGSGHHSRWASLKSAVKKQRGIGTQNLFR